MEDKKNDVRLEDRIDQSKRELLKRIAAGAAFTVPTVKSFSMKSIKTKFPRTMTY